MTAGVHTLFGAVSATVVAGALIWGLVLTGMPHQRRVERFDEQRLSDLQHIQAEIQALCHDPERPEILKQPLPQSLAELAERARQWRIDWHDPVTDAPYGYVVTGPSTYELTATFALPRAAGRAVFWDHPAGTHTFRIDVLDPP
ncbi:MAG: hypothetical protein IPM29_28180 [Planctomycetes bacterium]|nr:hypothetical protein [Planctomycetota bacterium]